MTIVCKVVDTSGRPLPAITVDFRNNSGGNRGVTDETGIVSVAVAEQDLEQIVINDIVIMNRPNAYTFHSPSVKDGLQVNVLVKNRTAIGLSNG